MVKSILRVDEDSVKFLQLIKIVQAASYRGLSVWQAVLLLLSGAAWKAAGIE